MRGCIKIWRKLTSKAGNIFTGDPYMEENLILSLWEFWQELKNQTSYNGNLCIPGTSYLGNTVYTNIQKPVMSPHNLEHMRKLSFQSLSL
jgi:hypothetical protein